MASSWIPAASALAAERPAASPPIQASSADVVPVRGGGGMGASAQGGMMGNTMGGMGSMNGGMMGSASMPFERPAFASVPSQQSPCATSLLTDLFRPAERARCLAQVHPADQGKASSVRPGAPRTAGN